MTERAPGWRPIENPPDDGDTVLGYWRNGEQHTGSVCEGEWVPAWEHQNDNWDLPTHWKPLDDGPHADGEKANKT